MSGNPALTYTTNVMFRCPDFHKLHDKGKGYRFIFIGPGGRVADHRRGQRRRPLPHVDRRHAAEDRAQRGRHPRRAQARDGPRLRLRNPLGDALGAARAGRRPLRHRARVHRRRRRAPDVADRRLRHEHRHRRRGRSRLEARSRPSKAGAAAALLQSYDAERRPVGLAQRRRGEPQPEAHAVDARAPARSGDLRARRGERRGAQGIRRLVRRRSCGRNGSPTA